MGSGDKQQPTIRFVSLHLFIYLFFSVLFFFFFQVALISQSVEKLSLQGTFFLHVVLQQHLHRRKHNLKGVSSSRRCEVDHEEPSSTTRLVGQQPNKEAACANAQRLCLVALKL